MGRSFYRQKSHRTGHIQVDNRRRKRSQQYMAHQSATKILRMKTTQGKICIQDIRDQCSWSNKDSAHQQHMYHCDLSIFMINKDSSFSTNICLIMAFPELFPMSTKKQNGWKDTWEHWPRAKELKTCLSPPMRVANKLTPETKSKMAEIMHEHTGQGQKSWKDA